MRRWVTGVLVAATVQLAGTANAADFAERLNGIAAPSGIGYSWAGGYFGVNLGYGWGHVTRLGGSLHGVAGGLQAGYNWQSGSFVLGGESDLQLSGADDRFAAWQFSNPWFGSLRARAGFAMNNTLFYATAGLAYGDLRMELAGIRETKTHIGWTAGAGMEVGLSRNWSARAEYLIMDLADRGYVMTGQSNGLESNLLRFGVNYRF
ncbi:MAG TPA: outer membrane protein [Xanthobacteraceae bacterium]|nr:outer membrane protein [Xanthobacteraceae bacterium]